MYHPSVITPPTLEPVFLHELKDHLRVVGSSEDDYIEALGKAARQHVEWRTGRTLFQTTFEQVFDDFPRHSGIPLFLLRAAPLLSVTWVKYTDADAAVTTWNASNYIVNTDSMPGCIIPAYNVTWPVFTAYPMGAVRVRYVAGLSASASPLVFPDEGIGHVIKLLVGAMYENREGEIVPDKPGVQAISLKYGVEALLSQYQVAFSF
jgi:uncharacterized phiE125 gp8 family phage protein